MHLANTTCEHQKHVRKISLCSWVFEFALGVRVVFAIKEKSTYKIFVSA